MQICRAWWDNLTAEEETGNIRPVSSFRSPFTSVMFWFLKPNLADPAQKQLEYGSKTNFARLR
jgi:hypothetical protein